MDLVAGYMSPDWFFRGIGGEWQLGLLSALAYADLQGFYGSDGG